MQVIKARRAPRASSGLLAQLASRVVLVRRVNLAGLDRWAYLASLGSMVDKAIRALLAVPDSQVSHAHRVSLTVAQFTPTATPDAPHGHDGPVRPPDALRRRAHLSGGRADSVHTATPDTTRRSCLCRVWCAGVNRTIAANVFRLQVSCRRPSLVVEDPIHTAEADTTQTGLFCRVCVAV